MSNQKLDDLFRRRCIIRETIDLLQDYESLESLEFADAINEFVYELKAEEAADINNGGVVGQLEYIDKCGALDDVLDLIKERQPKEFQRIQSMLKAHTTESKVP